MFTFGHAEERRLALKRSARSGNRLSRGRAVFVIFVLSIFSWAALAAIVLAVRALF
jgi:hypothetical protein